MLRDDDHPITSKFKYFEFIPLLIVIIVEQFSYFTDWFFYFTEDNVFHRGPLGFISQVVTILYMLIAIFEVVIAQKKNKKLYLYLVAIIITYVGAAMIIETYTTIRSLGISSAVYSIIFFMFSMVANNLNTAKKELKVLSEVDFLTKISNRYYGETKIKELLNSKKPGVFAILDIDKFKKINDTFGHNCGDEAIYKVAQVLKETLNENDVIMRLGGDEFAFYSPDLLDKQKMNNVILDLLERIRNISLTNTEGYQITISIGIATFDGNNFSSFTDLYRQADNNLYKAKSQNGNRCIQ